jgi:hypothetical protein
VIIRPNNNPTVGDRTAERCTPREYNAQTATYKQRK